MQITFIAGILVAIAGVLFALQNDVPVTVTFLVWRFDGSLALILLSSLAVGAAVAALITAPAAIRDRWTRSRQRRQIDDLRAEVDELRRRLADNAAAAPAGREAASTPAPPPAPDETHQREILGLKEIAAGSRDSADRR